MGIYQHLKSRGILSLNQRNIDFIMKYNPRKHFPIVDNKLLTKSLALEAGISVPKTYHVIQYEHQLKNLRTALANLQDFVIKPAHGSGGKGILVIKEQIKGRYRKNDNRIITIDTIQNHISNILSGLYSLAGQHDEAIIEYRVKKHNIFDKISAHGVPDIRVVVLLGYPIAAMLRLPTYNSSGKANLHQGAIGVGINIVSGKTNHGVYFNQLITEHPDTLEPIADVQIPQWHTLLNLAAKFYELSQLGYIGVDIVLDANFGPMVLEINARPGLNIQIANNEGLLEKCHIIEEFAKDHKLTSNERVNFILKRFKD